MSAAIAPAPTHENSDGTTLRKSGPPAHIKASFSDNARTVLAKRYLVKDANGMPVETPEDMFWRVATTIAEVDRRYGANDLQVRKVAEAFYALMVQRRFEPNSPTLMNAGRPLGQLSACFVLPVGDALANGNDGIYDTLRSMALIHQSGGGTGFSFSRLRARGSMVRSTTGVASGPVSFMKLYDASTDAVKQGGTRRGANMGILRVDHPDVMEFIACKEDLTQITNFNISVGITDKFMEALRAGGSYDLVDPNTGDVVGQLEARLVWDRMIQGAWRTGEPGVFFIDEANRYNPVPHLGAYEATNPCGEQPLLPYDVCNLGSINVGHYVVDGELDWVAFRRDIRLATHFLDNVIDANKFPLPEIENLSKRIRRIGLGVMGFADALVRSGVQYDSEEGVAFGRDVMRFLDTEAKAESERLAAERGAFPEWERSIWGPDETCARDEKGERIRPMQLLRNCNVTTVAPTGTISIIAGCSGGLEPLFAVAFMRNQAGVMMPDVNEDFVHIAKEHGFYSEALMEKIASTGSVNFPEVPTWVQTIFTTANQISPEWHVRMQAAFQEHCDSAISKTTNFAHTATAEDVRAIYELAYDLKCKGVTVYRDGSRDGQVLSTGTTAAASASRDGDGSSSSDERVQALEAEVAALKAEVRPKIELDENAPARRIKQASPFGNHMYVHVAEDGDGRPAEVFITLGKAGGTIMADVEAIGRLISRLLRNGHPMAKIIRDLRGISSEKAFGYGPNKVLSVPDAIAKALMAYEAGKIQEAEQEEAAPASSAQAPVLPPAQPRIQEPAKEVKAHAESKMTGAEPCPDCGSELQPMEGCIRCAACGFSLCS